MYTVKREKFMHSYIFQFSSGSESEIVFKPHGNKKIMMCSKLDNN